MDTFYFNLPMSRLLGVTAAAPGDWPLTTTVWMFNIAFAVLGVAAFAWGKWLERVGPRKAMFVAALCFSGGFGVAAAGVALHSLAILYAGFALYGVGLGLGYISPVSTLIKWFPDRPGMATGMAIMGFGGGALIGSPLAQNLLDHFKSATTVGVAQTFVTMGAIYFVFMMFGVVVVRVPPDGYRPSASLPAAATKRAAPESVSADDALKTLQFWLLWLVLFLNVTAGIGVLSQASPMIQEMFQGRVDAGAAAGFVGFISIFNLLGRFVWSSLSDPLGRKTTYAIYFALGTVLYCAVPALGRAGNMTLFVGAFCVIFTMYGGGRRGADAGHLHARVPAAPRRGEGRGVYDHDVCDGGAAGGGVRVQCAGAAGGGRAFGRERVNGKAGSRGGILLTERPANVA